VEIPTPRNRTQNFIGGKWKGEYTESDVTPSRQTQFTGLDPGFSNSPITVCAISESHFFNELCSVPKFSVRTGIRHKARTINTCHSFIGAACTGSSYDFAPRKIGTRTDRHPILQQITAIRKYCSRYNIFPMHTRVTATITPCTPAEVLEVSARIPRIIPALRDMMRAATNRFHPVFSPVNISPVRIFIISVPADCSVISGPLPVRSRNKTATIQMIHRTPRLPMTGTTTLLHRSCIPATASCIPDAMSFVFINFSIGSIR